MLIWEFVDGAEGLDDSLSLSGVVICLCISSCIIGLCFSVYSVMLYRKYNTLVQNAREQRARQRGPGNYGAGGAPESPTAETGSLVPNVNPMKRLAFAACCTTACFFVRAIVLAVLYAKGAKGVDSTNIPLYVFYFVMSETIPEALLLYAFATLISNAETVSTQGSSGGGSFATTPSTPLLRDSAPKISIHQAISHSSPLLVAWFATFYCYFVLVLVFALDVLVVDVTAAAAVAAQIMMGCVASAV